MYVVMDRTWDSILILPAYRKILVAKGQNNLLPKKISRHSVTVRWPSYVARIFQKNSCWTCS